jgi:hypothetical protein
MPHGLRLHGGMASSMKDDRILARIAIFFYLQRPEFVGPMDMTAISCRTGDLRSAS